MLPKRLRLSGAANALGQTLLTFTEPFGPRATLAAYTSSASSSRRLSPTPRRSAWSPGRGHRGGIWGLDPRPFTIALALAASADYSTPIGCQLFFWSMDPVDIYLDFTRVGLPLTCLCLVITITILPMYWPLTG